MHLHNDSNKQRTHVSWYKLSQLNITVTKLYNMLSTRLKCINMARRCHNSHYSPKYRTSQRWRWDWSDASHVIGFWSHQQQTLKSKYRGFYWGGEMQRLFPVLKGKCVCYSSTSHLQTNTHWQFVAGLSVLNLHSTPPCTPASCDNTKTHPPEGWFVPCVLFCIYVMFFSSVSHSKGHFWSRCLF